MLHIQKELAHPLSFWAANYFAHIDSEVCTGCGICIDICQVGAAVLHERAHTAEIDLSKCIGCGNCVTRCPVQAIVLIKKESARKPPETMETLFDTILAHKKGFLKKLALGLKIVLNINPKQK